MQQRKSSKQKRIEELEQRVLKLAKDKDDLKEIQISREADHQTVILERDKFSFELGAKTITVKHHEIELDECRNIISSQQNTISSLCRSIENITSRAEVE